MTPYTKEDDSAKNSNPTPSTALSSDSPIMPSPFASYGIFMKKKNTLLSNINVNNIEDSKVILKSNSHLNLT